MKQAMISNHVRKIQPAKTIRFFHEKMQRFLQQTTHSLRLNCHSTCPWRHRILLCERTSSLYESYQTMLEKYNQRKRLGSSMRKFNFSTKMYHIVCASIGTQHARGDKEYYSPRGQAVSTSHMLSPLGGRFASANVIC